MERDLIGWSWQETLLHLEDEQRSGTGVFEEMAKKFNPYRQAASDKQRVWSQIRVVEPVICQECGQPIDIRMELIIEDKHEECAKKESK